MTLNFLTIDADNIQQLIVALSPFATILALVTLGMSAIRWVMTYERRHRENMEKYNEWYDDVISNPNPDRKSLLKLPSSAEESQKSFVKPYRQN